MAAKIKKGDRVIINAKPGVPAAMVSRSARSISVVVRTSMPNPQSLRLFERQFL